MGLVDRADPSQEIRMFVSDENGDESRKEMAALDNLGESIQSLLGSKTELTFTWGDAVRFMIKDLCSDSNSVSFQPSPTEKNVRISEVEKIQLEEDIAKLEGMHTIYIYVIMLVNQWKHHFRL